MQRWFERHADECMKNKTHLGFSMMTSSVNVVYQMCHLYTHIFEGGIGLRQLMDYYFALKVWHNDVMECQDLQSQGMWSEGLGTAVMSKEEVMAATGEPQRLYLRNKRIPVMSDSTFRGRINIGLNYLKSHFPEKQIVLLTPIHRAYAKFSDDNVQPDERYQNKCGAYIDDYVQAVKEAANVWSVPVIDLNAVSGLNPMLEGHLPLFRDPSFDRLHPNSKGHERIARTLYYQLMALPCLF